MSSSQWTGLAAETVVLAAWTGSLLPYFFKGLQQDPHIGEVPCIYKHLGLPGLAQANSPGPPPTSTVSVTYMPELLPFGLLNYRSTRRYQTCRCNADSIQRSLTGVRKVYKSYVRTLHQTIPTTLSCRCEEAIIRTLCLLAGSAPQPCGLPTLAATSFPPAARRTPRTFSVP